MKIWAKRGCNTERCPRNVRASCRPATIWVTARVFGREIYMTENVSPKHGLVDVGCGQSTVVKSEISVYGRRTYEIMRYWDEDLPDWDAEDREFAVVWRSQPKWVVSRSLKSVGPNSTLVADDFEKVIRRLKAELAGEIQVGGPVLAQSLTEAGLIDEYRLYLRPVVFGGGQPFFAGPRPPLHLVASDLIADDLIRLTYVPA